MSKHRTHETIWNRLLSGVLCLALMLGLLPAAGLVQMAGAAHWAEPYAQKLVDWGIMRPELASDLGTTITRADFVAMCNRAFGYHILGGTPFVDVPYTEWYAEDIDIAYNAGYFTGTSDTTAEPNGTLTREMAAVAVARNLMLQEAVGESLGFTDSRDLHDWSRGLIATAVADGIITGLPDGSFHPFDNITCGEVAVLLVRSIGTPVREPGVYDPLGGGDVYGNVTINSSNVSLRDTTIVGNLYLTGGVDLGNVLLENVTVMGKIVISGGGESHEGQSSVVLRNVAADELLVDSIIDQFVTISAYGLTDIPFTSVRTNAFLEDASASGYGLKYIELNGEPGTLLQLSGNIKEVKNLTPFSDLRLVKGTAQKITIDEYAKGSMVTLSEGTLVYEMNLDVATLVTGDGDIKHLTVGAAGCEVDILPEEVTIREGLTADIDGEIVGDLTAAELSSEPRLLAGYPEVTNVTPTQAEVLFSVNKPGTVYWAVSERASGSVDVDDLIRNPVYGGNIYAKQAGSFSIEARKEVGRQIINLVPDGSYYISAVLVDGRGNRSPLKVVSFTTPDNTVPAFVGTPYMSKETCQVAQVTATANKNCQLYYALLTEGAEAPTPNEFKTGSIGNKGYSYGYGSVSMVKNAPISINVNTNRLREKTTYWLYLWLSDLDGTQSMAAPLRLEFKTPDETPPIVSAPIQTGVYEKTAGITYSINEAPATLYWAVVAEGDETFISPSADLSSLRTKITVENGVGAINDCYGSSNYTTVGRDVTFTISKLDYAVTGTNNFIMYYVAKDAAGNYSDQVGYIRIRTLDTEPPRVEISFTNTVNGEPKGQPFANTDIKLEFSEQVKGGSAPSTETSGNAPVTFLDFYNQVLASAGNTQTQQAARNRLAEELAKHIELYYQPRGGQASLVTPLHELEAANADTSNWVIDWRYATLAMESGKVVLTLSSSGLNPALQLDSGATYYFRFLDVFDNAYKPNGLMGNRYGNYTTDRFTTVYAQVELRENSGLDRIDSGEYADIRLDVCFDVIPTSTGKVPETEYWDMIIWSDTQITVDIYRQETDDKGTKLPWEKLTRVTGPITMFKTGTASEAAFGLTPTTGGTYGTVPGTLQEGHSYRYGIHITKLGAEDEADPAGKGKPVTWGADITMRFSLIAGGLVNVQNVSSSMRGTNPQYNSSVSSGKVSEIGTDYSTMEAILVYPKSFEDERQPDFEHDYPKFEMGSASVDIKVRMTRAGIAHVVVAEASGTPPSLASGSIGRTFTPASGYEVRSSAAAAGGVANPAVDAYYRDGRHIDTVWMDDAGKTYTLTEDEKTDALEYIYRNFGRTYIPTGGADREEHAKYVSYMNVAGETTANYTSPYFGYITDPQNGFGDSSGVFYPDEPISYQASETNVVIGGLKPDTWYYVYFVLQGSGVPSETVQCYRFKTTTVQTPSVVVSGTSSTATMTPSDDCLMYFALVQYSELESWIKTTQSGQSSSYLTQMMTRANAGSTTGPSQFDANASATIKRNMALYITSSSDVSVKSWQLPRDDLLDNGIVDFPNGMVPGNTPVTWDFDKEGNSDMDSLSSTYVVLVAVKQVHGGDSGDDYGFGAISNLHAKDREAPQYKAPDYGDYVKPTILKMTRVVDNGDGTYNGYVTISFTKELYYHSDADGIRYSLTYGASSDSAKNVLELLEGSAVDMDCVSAGTTGTGSISSTISLRLDGISDGDTIIFPKAGGSICNSSDYSTASRLTLTFHSQFTVREYYTDTVDTNPGNTNPGDAIVTENGSTVRGFTVSWR